MTAPIDLLVVGAGVVGVFSALHAARSGASVLLVERDDWPRSASVRNFGMAIPSGMEPGPALRHAEASVAIYQSLAEAGAVRVTGRGTIYCATTPLEAQVLVEMATLGPRLGLRCALLDRDLLRHAHPEIGETVMAGLHFPDDAQVDQRTLGRTLIPWMVETFGVTYRPETTIVGITREADGIRARTAAGDDIAAARALICAGPETRVLFPDVFADAGVRLCKLQMVRTAPGTAPALPSAIASGWSLRRYGSFGIAPSRAALLQQPMPEFLRERGIHVLIKPEADGSLTIGDSHAYAPGEDAQHDLLDAAVEDAIVAEAKVLLPHADLRVAERWIGRYPVFPEGEWWITHPLPEIAIVATGGAGMTLSPSLTRGIVSDLLDS